MLNNAIVNQINCIGLNQDLGFLKEIVKENLDRLDVEMILIDHYYKDKLRDLELIEKLNNVTTRLLALVKCINTIETKAIEYKDTELMFKCENLKAKLINAMTYIENKYMF